MAAATTTVKPAAGPLTLRDAPLIIPTITPPTIPAMIPAIGGAPEPSAIPIQSGRATRNTTSEADRSACIEPINFFTFSGLAALWFSVHGAGCEEKKYPATIQLRKQKKRR